MIEAIMKRNETDKKDRKRGRGPRCKDEGKAQTLQEAGNSMHTVLEQSSHAAGLAGKGGREVAKENNLRGDKSTVMVLTQEQVWDIQEPGFIEIKIECGKHTGRETLVTK